MANPHPSEQIRAEFGKNVPYVFQNICHMPQPNPTLTKVRLHDFIVGALYLTSIILALNVNLQFIYIAGAVAILQVLSLVTRFCPVYFVLNKIIPGGETVQNGPSGS